MRFKSQVISVLAIALLAGSAPVTMAQSAGAPAPNTPQVAQPDQGGVNWKGVGVGAGTVAGNVLYVPAKLVYGILGGIAGGAGYALTGGNQQVSDTIWRSSLGGDYVLTPDMVTGKKPVHFSGPTQTAQSDASTGGDPSGSGLSFARSGSSAPSSPAIAPAQGASGPSPIDSGAGPVGRALPVQKSAPAPDSGIE
ncbi:MAG TPA: hypothetical protein VKS22_12610 [Candidatus Binataceae bacterium]|nr:hypothetical protein [Candidatus Binataceae bacterium]